MKTRDQIKTALESARAYCDGNITAQEFRGSLTAIDWERVAPKPKRPHARIEILSVAQYYERKANRARIKRELLNAAGIALMVIAAFGLFYFVQWLDSLPL